MRWLLWRLLVHIPFACKEDFAEEICVLRIYQCHCLIPLQYEEFAVRGDPRLNILGMPSACT